MRVTYESYSSSSPCLPRGEGVCSRACGDATHRDAELDEELRYHVEQQTEANVRAGMSPEEARRQALLQFGNVPLVKEDTRAVWTWARLEQVLQDLRFGARILTRSPGLSATAAILIALVVGINTTIFSMVNGIVRRPAPASPPKIL